MKEKNRGARKVKPFDNWIKVLIFLFPLFCVAVLYIIFIKKEGFFARLIAEDSIFETIQFHLYFFSAIFSFFVFKYLKKREEKKWKVYAFLLLSLAFCFIAFEEISWGQRILGLNTPEWIAERNAQRETTLHNLNPIQLKMHYLYIVIGVYGVLSRAFLQIFFRKHFTKLEIFTPEYFLIPYFLLAIIFWTSLNTFLLPHLTGDILASWQWQEVFEMLLAFGFFFYIFYTYRKVKVGRAE